MAMVNCPRCGFSQPQDQYCARCGIDMMAFRPTQKPLLARVLRSTFVQITVLVTMVVSAFLIAHRHRQAELAERVREIENARNSQIITTRSNVAAPASAGDKSDLASNGADESKPTDSRAPGTATALNRSGQPAMPSEAAVASDPIPTTGSNNFTGEDSAAKAVAKVPSAINVKFVQTSRAFLGDLINAAELNSGTLNGPFLSGVAQGLASRTKALQAAGHWEILDSSSRSVKTAQPAEFYGGQRDESSGQFLGFMIEATAIQLTETESIVQLKVWRNLRDGGGQVEEFAIPLPDSFTIPSGASAVISGSQLLPHRQLTESERRFYDPLKVLHILATEEYRLGSTELVIVIEPR